MTGEVIKEIKNKIAELNATYMKYHNWEQGTKIMINSFYGGLANPYMYFFDPSLAECITKQGKNAILYAESYINEYFQQHWMDDTCTHRKMGIKVFKPVIGQATVYIDTDSTVGSTGINISDMISIETKHGIQYYHKDDIVKVLRDDKEIEIKISDIKESDLIWQE